LIETSMKSCKPKDTASPDDTPPPDSGRNPEVDFKGKTRSDHV
jgi:hypothetical protein